MVRLFVGMRVTLFRWLIVTFGAFIGLDPKLVWLFKLVVLLVMATVQAVVMVLFDVANMLFVLVRMIAVPSVSVPLIFARQLFMVVLSLYVIRPPPCADLRLIQIIAVLTLVSCRMLLASSLRVTIVALRIRQLVR